MTKLYLAGPYSGTDEEVKENIHKAIKAATKLRDRGFNVFLPHANFVYCEDLEPTMEGRKKIFQLCYEWIDICDVVAFMPGWKKSPGACAEFKKAHQLHKKIIYLTESDI
jgi:nucleoside 2-deoxyribosyltransferase